MEKPYGRNEYVKNIFLRGSGEIPEDIKKKVKIIDIKKIWNQLNLDSQSRILNIFGLDIEKLKLVETRDTILFTQPFSEDKIISENEKIELYRKIIEKYNKNSLMIKVHPREKTEYDKIFKNVVTISSTAVSVFLKSSDIDFYGSEIHPKILNYFGNLDFFMKRNQFIDR